MSPFKKTIFAMATTVAFAAAPAFAQAQAQQPPAQQPPAQQTPPSQYGQPQQQRAEFSEDELRKFASAQKEVVAVRDEYTQRMQGNEDPVESQRLQTRAQEKMTEVVAEEGLDPQTYNAIAMAVQNDPELQNRIARMEDER